MAEIQSDINNLIDDIAGNITSAMFAVQRLIRAPSKFIDSTLNKINVYKNMVEDIKDSIKDDFETDPSNRKNNAIILQSTAGFAVAVLAEAAIYTDYTSRADTTHAVDAINDALEIFNDAFADSITSGNVSNQFSGDHNFFSLMFDCTSRIKNIIFNQAFDLKAEKKFILKNNSDAVTLCYEHYGKVDSDTLDYFILTNKLCCDEFIEIARGREIVVYV